MKKIFSCFVGVFLLFLVVSISYADCRGYLEGVKLINSEVMEILAETITQFEGA